MREGVIGFDSDEPPVQTHAASFNIPMAAIALHFQRPSLHCCADEFSG